MGKLEIKLYFRAESKVTFGEEVFTDDSFSQFSDEIEVDPDGCDTYFSEYELMYNSVLDHLNFKTEKTWCKYNPPTSIEIKITQMTKEEFRERMN